jgi:hypothetical protein
MVKGLCSFAGLIVQLNQLFITWSFVVVSKEHLQFGQNADMQRGNAAILSGPLQVKRLSSIWLPPTADFSCLDHLDFARDLLHNASQPLITKARSLEVT